MRLPIGQRRVARCADPAWPRAVRLFCNEPKLSTNEVRVFPSSSSSVSHHVRLSRFALRDKLVTASRSRSPIDRKKTRRPRRQIDRLLRLFSSVIRVCGGEHTFSENRTRRGFALRFPSLFAARPEFRVRARAMVDIEVVELLDSSEDEAPAMQAEPDVEEVTVNRQIRAPEAAAGDDDDDVIVTGALPLICWHPFLSAKSAPTTRPLPYRATPRAPTVIFDAAHRSLKRAARRSPRFQRQRALAGRSESEI